MCMCVCVCVVYRQIYVYFHLPLYTCVHSEFEGITLAATAAGIISHVNYVGIEQSITGRPYLVR